MFVLPQGYELITKGRTSIALHERYRDCLLGQGIDDPEKLLRSAGPQQSALAAGEPCLTAGKRVSRVSA